MDRKKMGKAARNKGANAERELAHLIQDMWGYDVRRGMVFNNQSDLIGLKEIHVEVKRVENLNLRAAMDQAIREAEKRQDGIPAVFHRRSRERWKVTMELRDLLTLCGVSDNDSSSLITMPIEDWMDIYGGWINA